MEKDIIISETNRGRIEAELSCVYRAGEMGILIELIDLPEGGVSA